MNLTAAPFATGASATIAGLVRLDQGPGNQGVLEELARCLDGCGCDFYVLTFGNSGSEFDQDFAERALKVLAKSRHTGMYALGKNIEMICLSRWAWDRLKPFLKDSDQPLGAMLAETATHIRSFTSIRVISPKQTKRGRPAAARTESIPEVQQEAALQSPPQATPLTSTEANPQAAPQAPLQAFPPPPETKVLESIQHAVECLQNEKNAEALKILREVIPFKEDMPALFYAKAIAEARLGMIGDAESSLERLLLREPAHIQGRDLLNMIRTRTNRA